MKLFLTVVLFLSGLIPVFAQYPDSTNGPGPVPEAPKTRILKLDADIPVHHFAMPVKDIQVIAICGDSVNLGYVPHRRSRVIAIPDKPFQEYLQQYVNRQYSDQYKRDSGKNLLCLIQLFRIAQGSVDKSYVRVKAVVFLSADNEQFQLSYQTDTTLVYDSHVHSKNMAVAIDHLMKAADRSNVTTAFHSRDEILTIAWKGYKQPVYTDAKLNNGIYISYREFLKNTPAVTNFTLDVKYGKVVAWQVHDDSSRTIINKPWGMCYHEQFYYYNKDWFIPVERQGFFFVFPDPAFKSPPNNKITGAEVAEFAGWAGGAVASTIFLGVVPGGWRMPRSSVPGGNLLQTLPYIYHLIDPPIATMIDPYTGELMF